MSVRARSRRQPWAARSAATRRASAEVFRAAGLSGVVASSAHRYEVARSIAVDCQTRPARPRQAADVEAVEADELARVIHLDVAGRLGRPALGPGRCGVAGDEGQAADPPGQTVTAQDAPDPVGTAADAAPARLGERRADAPRAEARVAQAEGEDALLDEDARLVRHPRRSTFTGSEHLEPRAQDGGSPAVVGRGMDPEDAARLADVAELGSEAEQPQAEGIEDVIIDHGAAPPAHRFRHDKHGDAAPRFTWAAGSQVSGELGDCSG
jgi:hypothetical protein